MWQKVKPLLIILSVALNVPFVALWAAHNVPAREPAPQPSLSPLPSQAPSPALSRPPFRPPSSPSRGGSVDLFRTIGVTDEQLSEIEPRMARFREATSQLGREMGQHHQKFFELIAAPELDHDAIQAEQAQILQGNRKMQELVLENLLADKAILTPEQQATYFAKIRQSCGPSWHGATKGGHESSRKFGWPPGKNPGFKKQ